MIEFQIIFAPDLTQTREIPAEVVIHDSTLRDGEQAPGVGFGGSAGRWPKKQQRSGFR